MEREISVEQLYFHETQMKNCTKKLYSCFFMPVIQFLLLNRYTTGFVLVYKMLERTLDILMQNSLSFHISLVHIRKSLSVQYNISYAITIQMSATKLKCCNSITRYDSKIRLYRIQQADVLTRTYCTFNIHAYMSVSGTNSSRYEMDL